MSDIQEQIKIAHRKALEQDFNEIIKELKQEEHKNIELSMRINKAIEYFNELEKENNKIIKFEVQHDEYQHITAEAENILIDNVKNILKGDNK